MNKVIFPALVVAVAFAIAPVAVAQQVQPIELAQTETLADGEIKRIKKGSTRLTVKHGEIPSLQMPPMTMEFEARDEAMLENLKKGDKIKFKVIDQDRTGVVNNASIA
jgi:Cu/Ag efflux protein CusF